MKSKLAITMLALAGMACCADASAGTVAGSLTVQLIIGNGCSVGNGTVTGNANSFGVVDFGQQASPIVNYVDAESAGSNGGSIQLTCSTGATYTVALDGGLHASGTTRQMSNGTDNVAYGLYQDAARALPWGNGTTFGTALAGVGTGAAQIMDIFARVPPQASVSAGTYTDTVLVTVTW